MSRAADAELSPNATPEENARFVAFRSFLEAEGLSPVTCACYASDWMNIAERMRMAAHRPFQLDHLTVEAFLEYRAAAAARGVSAATLNRRLAFLRRYARFAAATIPACAALSDALASLAYQPVKALGGRSALSRDEEERLMQASERVGASEHALVALLTRTGLRVEEILALRRGDVAGPASAPKSLRVRGKREKTVLLPPLTSHAVGALIAAEPGEDDDALFRARGRFAMGRGGAAAAVTRCARAAHVRASLRTLRHTFAVRYLAEHEDDVDGLSSALGGASPGLLRAWRDEAGAGAPKARVVPWTDADGRDGVDELRAARIEAVRRRIRPGAKTPIPAITEDRLLLVVAGAVSIRVGKRPLEAGVGDAVFLPGGAAATLVALGAKSATVVAAAALRRR